MAEKEVPEFDVYGNDGHILIAAEAIRANPKRLAKALAQVKLYADQYGILSTYAKKLTKGK